MKKTGIELIAEERQEQIEKHGFDVDNDEDYGQMELIQACLFCLDQYTRSKEGNINTNMNWPYDWDLHFRDKIFNKDDIGKLKVAGAFIAAEIDRIQAE